MFSNIINWDQHKKPAAEMSPLPEEFDIIVCGGGSCGCVVAGRLANLDHNLKVLLIEAGESNLNNVSSIRRDVLEEAEF